MNNITICYSTHRLETLELTSKIMEDHDVIILEEPFHNDFAGVLDGSIEISEHLLELDVGYPEFTLGQYQMLQQFSHTEKTILQIEPYLDHLLSIQYFLADDHSPEEITPNTDAYSVYLAERYATGKLLDYYKEVQVGNFEKLLSTMNSFAKADAARFILRDTLRVKHILNALIPGKQTYIEAGSIHLLLSKLLQQNLEKEWHLQVHSIDREAIKSLDQRGNLFSPGDELTLHYVWGRDVSLEKWQLRCAQSLIYSKIISKEETLQSDETFPHTRNELESIAAVKNLTIEACKRLFKQIKTLQTEDAAFLVKNCLKN